MCPSYLSIRVQWLRLLSRDSHVQQDGRWHCQNHRSRQGSPVWICGAGVSPSLTVFTGTLSMMIFRGIAKHRTCCRQIFCRYHCYMIRYTRIQIPMVILSPWLTTVFHFIPCSSDQVSLIAYFIFYEMQNRSTNGRNRCAKPDIPKNRKSCYCGIPVRHYRTRTCRS